MSASGAAVNYENSSKREGTVRDRDCRRRQLGLPEIRSVHSGATQGASTRAFAKVPRVKVETYGSDQICHSASDDWIDEIGVEMASCSIWRR